jgi:hypothetical protein
MQFASFSFTSTLIIFVHTFIYMYHEQHTFHLQKYLMITQIPYESQNISELSILGLNVV